MKLRILKIDGHIWKVKYRKQPSIDGQKVEGFFDESEHTIIIKKTEESYQEEILLHELVHIAGDELYAFEEKDDTTQKFNLFTRRLYQILKDNGLLSVSDANISVKASKTERL